MESLAVDIGESFDSPFGKSGAGGVGLGELVSIILSNALVVAGVILLFLLVLGGIGIIAGAGNDNPEQTAKGKQAVTAAVIGFIIVFASYWIIQVIQSITGVEILNPGF